MTCKGFLSMTTSLYFQFSKILSNHRVYMLKNPLQIKCELLGVRQHQIKMYLCALYKADWWEGEFWTVSNSIATGPSILERPLRNFGVSKQLDKIGISTDTCFILTGLISVAQKIECRTHFCHQSAQSTSTWPLHQGDKSAWSQARAIREFLFGFK